MTAASYLQWGVLIVLVVIATPLLGRYMAAVYGADGDHAPGDRVFKPVERVMYRLTGVDEKREQRWQAYAFSLLAFSLISVLFLYLLQRIQASLPVNPTDVPNVPAALSYNTAVSFVTNTNWQNYGPETTVSHLTQMVGLATQNFVSAAVGSRSRSRSIRGLTRRGVSARSATSGSTSRAR